MERDPNITSGFGGVKEVSCTHDSSNGCQMTQDVLWQAINLDSSKVQRENKIVKLTSPQTDRNHNGARICSAACSMGSDALAPWCGKRDQNRSCGKDNPSRSLLSSSVHGSR